ncbi:beta-N-acetylhexosaminidase [Bacillus sp. JJ1764]|uniref:beta-N-acetylhexosaminidase n=1 Tax=Bacillus sp. JJ1764 TaxID=3122964 RepID=UPI002FFDCE5F
MKALSKTLIIAVIILTGCTNNNVNRKEQQIHVENTTNQYDAKRDIIEDQLNKMTLNEKIGQMIISGIDGTSLTSSTKELVTQYKLGGFILFKPNVKDTTKLVSLTNALKTANTQNKVPLFISVDQEGGRVNRMPNSILNTPAVRAIGNLNNEKYSYNIGKVIGRELSVFGFNTDFAPVLDIQTNINNTVIGDRSFGSDSQLVSKLGISMMKGIKTNGIIPVVKHFPGHGDTSVDSHLELPVVLNDLARLKRVELVPFVNSFKANADMVMVAHILVKKVDPLYPASLSKPIIQDLLRNQLGFRGVIITDDVTMGAIIKHYSLRDAVIRSINAGSDMVLVGHGKENAVSVYNSLLSAVKNKSISMERINNSVYRILSLKNKYNITNNKVVPVNIVELNSQIKQASNIHTVSSDSEKTELLKSISLNAKNGTVIDNPFHIKTSTIDMVRKVWGREDSSSYIPSLKGTYSTYTKKNIVVAYSQGQQLFEIRSYNPTIKNLSIEDVKNYFGNPTTDIITGSNEEIVSYNINANTLKFVFKKQTLLLDHYSIYSR